MQTEEKISIIVALVLIVTALYDLRISASIATVYLIIYGVRRLRKQRLSSN